MKSQAYRMALLYDFYGDVLTPRQKEFYDLYYNEDLSVKSIQEFYPGTDKIMKEEYNLDFKNFKRDYRQFYEDGTIQEEGHMKGGEVVFAKEYYKNRQLKCVKKIQNVYGYKILTVTELYDESGKPLPIPSGTF